MHRVTKGRKAEPVVEEEKKRRTELRETRPPGGPTPPPPPAPPSSESSSTAKAVCLPVAAAIGLILLLAVVGTMFGGDGRRPSRSIRLSKNRGNSAGESRAARSPAAPAATAPQPPAVNPLPSGVPPLPPAPSLAAAPPAEQMDRDFPFGGGDSPGGISNLDGGSFSKQDGFPQDEEGSPFGGGQSGESLGKESPFGGPGYYDAGDVGGQDTEKDATPSSPMGIITSAVEKMKSNIQEMVEDQQEEDQAEKHLAQKFLEDSQNQPEEYGEETPVDGDDNELQKPAMGAEDCFVDDFECEERQRKRAEERLRPKALDEEDTSSWFGWGSDGSSSLFGDGGEGKSQEELEVMEKLKKRMGGYPEADADDEQDEGTDSEPAKKDGIAFGVSQNRLKEAFSTAAETFADEEQEDEGWLDSSVNFVSGLFGMGVDGENKYGEKGIERVAQRLERSKRSSSSSSSEETRLSFAPSGDSLRDVSEGHEEMHRGRFDSTRGQDDDGENALGKTRDAPHRDSFGFDRSSAPATGGRIRAVQDVRQHRQSESRKASTSTTTTSSFSETPGEADAAAASPDATSSSGTGSKAADRWDREEGSSELAKGSEREGPFS